MSVASLATGDTIITEVEIVSRGSQFGTNYSVAQGRTLDCHVQQMSAAEALQFDATGQTKMFTAFFATNPQLLESERVRITLKGGVVVDIPAKILGVEAEGRPGADYLWIATLQHISTRKEDRP